LSTHMRGLPRLCVDPLKLASMLEQLWLGLIVVSCWQSAFHAYAWMLYAYAWKDEAC
ncbi:hypothetical protein PIB30_096516, partial [Stylosanthes scabra]|nr:hypothetical protein [Stylosanthes scabra]